MEKIKKQKTKFIFVTGGVLSGLGKGVSASSLGRLLKSRNFKVFAQKFDPYYNVDPGTLNPYEHGEVYVTIDGAETDLDLGHYERIIGESFTKESNYVQGKLLAELIEEERNGVYGGSTIQVIPHVTNKIINKIEKAAQISNANFVITEIGGTVGDIESQPFLAAISQFSKIYRGQCYFIHATYVPYLQSSKEFKSKPTQNSIAKLQSFGIFPNMILLRSNEQIGSKIAKKVSSKFYIPHELCIPVPDLDSIYKIPLHFEKFEMVQKILKYFGMKRVEANLENWKQYVNLIDAPKTKTLTIAMVGKYVEFKDAYFSIIEAIRISSYWNKVNVKFEYIKSDEITLNNISNKIKDASGVIILPGFGSRGFKGKVIAAQYTREKDVPTLGICYGMQAMTIAQAISVGFKNATSSEISKEGEFIIDIINKKNIGVGGTLRLGQSKTKLVKGSLASKLYQSMDSFERHRHRYEVNPRYIDKIQDKDFIFSGFDSENNLAEICEMPNKKFYIGLQAHPEFNAQPLKEHPIFKGFIKSMI